LWEIHIKLAGTGWRADGANLKISA